MSFVHSFHENPIFSSIGKKKMANACPAVNNCTDDGSGQPDSEDFLLQNVTTKGKFIIDVDKRKITT